MNKLLTVVALSTVLAACGGGNDSNDNSNENANNDANDNNENEVTEQTSNLAGHTWRVCNEFSATSSEFVYVFTETDFVSTYSTYGDNSCSGTPVTSDDTAAGTYTLGSAVTTSGGFQATEIDFDVTSTFGAALPPANQYTLYDIYYIDNDVLYFGIERSRNAGDRTDTIDTTEAYIREQ
jgi:hypothetical protein